MKWIKIMFSSSPNGTVPSLEANSTDNEYTPYGDRIETYLVPVIFAIIFVVGVLGNGTLVIVYVRHRGMRNAPNTYIFSLALADLLVILICVPFVSVIYTLESWPWGELICRISEAAKDVSIGVSVFTLTALSAERYCAIVNPFRKLQLRKLPLVCATFIWAAALLFATPAAVISSTVTVNIHGNVTIVYCTPYPPDWPNYHKWMTLTKAVVYYGLPLLVISFFYSLMAQRLLASTREMPGALHGGQGEAQAKARKSVACMVLIFVIELYWFLSPTFHNRISSQPLYVPLLGTGLLSEQEAWAIVPTRAQCELGTSHAPLNCFAVFFVCFLPYHAFELWFHLSPTAQSDFNDWTNALRIMGFCLSFLNSCVNPVALYCVSGVFRQHFNRYLCCRRGSLHPTCSSRLSRTAVCETSFRSTHRHRCNRNPSESVVISNYDYGSTKKKSNIMSRNNSDGVTIMSIRDTSDFLTGDAADKCINR
ncbi:hypothetical protein MSG28_013131 [Choristoneura fumiferana]|uniref:Uncharacterized protein n=1 Tax=Choristoneura fumiferana TaxID=7141 RepID=A0ACC0KSM6_CHOFU|nr:hypothetical protein MSG28_013131 [Choristoneura fumiferana]